MGRECCAAWARRGASWRIRTSLALAAAAGGLVAAEAFPLSALPHARPGPARRGAASVATAVMADFSSQHGPAPGAQEALRLLAAEAQENIAPDDALDVYGSGSVVQLLEREVAAALGKTAAAFVTTGTAANQACAFAPAACFYPLPALF